MESAHIRRLKGVRWAGSPSILITILDNFNDLVLQRLSRKHKSLIAPFKKAAGKNKIPDYGAWLRNPSVISLLPKSSPILLDCHDLRVRADVAHATQKKSGQFTRPVSYYETRQASQTNENSLQRTVKRVVCAIRGNRRKDFPWSRYFYRRNLPTLDDVRRTGI